jgi:hypothetical protein
MQLGLNSFELSGFTGLFGFTVITIDDFADPPLPSDK